MLETWFMSSDDPLPVRRRLWHEVPSWVEDGAWFFITIACADRSLEQLTLPDVSTPLLKAAGHYHEAKKWHVGLFLLMPDHLHALLGFPHGGKPMAALLHDWKRYTARTCGVRWQTGFFDHRLRSEDEVDYKFRYILRNPVVKGLCEAPGQWPHQMRLIGGKLVIGKETASTGSEG